MVEVLPLEIEEVSDRLFIHFDVKDHYLSLTTFIQTADSARRIVEALDRTLFRGEGGFEIIVLPPSPGTFLQRLGVHPKKKLTTAAVAVFLCTPQGEAFTKGLTGQTTSDWFEDAGGLLYEALEAAAAALLAGDEGMEDNVDAVQYDTEVACTAAARIVTSMTRGILELGTETLNKIGMELGDLPDALDARAQFYEACYNDPDVKQIGFTSEDDFPIPRNSFAERAQKPPRRKKEEDEPEWVVSLEPVRVDSPTWDQDKQKTRQWLGVDFRNRDCYFVIEDAQFWGRIKNKELHFEGSDQLKVQWAYQMVAGKAKHRRVLRVLEFNGVKLSEPLSPDAISAILGNYSNGQPSPSEPTLFGTETR